MTTDFILKGKKPEQVAIFQPQGKPGNAQQVFVLAHGFMRGLTDVEDARQIWLTLRREGWQRADKLEAKH